MINVHTKRFSDRWSFWAVSLTGLAAVHYYVYVRLSPLVAGTPWRLLWIAACVVSVASSWAAKRVIPQRLRFRHVSIKSAVDRLASCWNTLVLVVAGMLLFFEIFGVASSPLVAFSSLLGGIGVCAYGLHGAYHVCTTKMELRTAKLQRGVARLRIVQLSDLHLGPFVGPTHLSRIIRAAIRADPDLVVITGDIVDGRIEGSERYATLFHELTPRYGIVAVPGNHDYFDDIEVAEEFMRECGIRPLRGEVIEVGGIIVAGADDRDHLKHSESGSSVSCSEAMMSSIVDSEFSDGSKFVLLLRHRPVVESSTLGLFDLQLSGHTHGGQVFPLPSSRMRIGGHSRGLAYLGLGSYIYVSNGAGFVGPPMRFLAPAEIAVIDLLRSPAHRPTVRDAEARLGRRERVAT